MLGIGGTVVKDTSSLSEYLGFGFYFSILWVLLGKLFPQEDYGMNSILLALFMFSPTSNVLMSI